MRDAIYLPEALLRRTVVGTRVSCLRPLLGLHAMQHRVSCDQQHGWNNHECAIVCTSCLYWRLSTWLQRSVVQLLWSGRNLSGTVHFNCVNHRNANARVCSSKQDTVNTDLPILPTFTKEAACPFISSSTEGLLWTRP